MENEFGTCPGCNCPMECAKKGCAVDEARGSYFQARVIGVGRDAENAKTLVVYWDKEPSDNDLRRTHDLLRSNPKISGAEASASSSS